MPSFKLPPRSATLVFEDGRLKGLELKVRLDVPMAFYFKLQKWRDTTGEDDLIVTRDVMRQFAERALVSWNLTDDDDQPVPTTPDALEDTLDPLTFGLMLGKYLGAIGTVDPPLARRSANGVTSAKRRALSPHRSSAKH